MKSSSLIRPSSEWSAEAKEVILSFTEGRTGGRVSERDLHSGSDPLVHYMS